MRCMNEDHRVKEMVDKIHSSQSYINKVTFRTAYVKKKLHYYQDFLHENVYFIYYKPLLYHSSEIQYGLIINLEIQKHIKNIS